MKLRAPSHGTVVAYLALFVAIGGSAYAVSKVGSGDIKNRSIRGADVADDSLGTRQVAEATLSGPVAVGDEPSGSCDPPPGPPVDCVGATIVLERESALLVIASGSKAPDAGSGICTMSVDGAGSNSEFVGGSEQDGFALTKVTSPLDPGPHTVALRCTESGPNLTIDNPTIAAVAVSAPSP